jgi:hypothetical protein
MTTALSVTYDDLDRLGDLMVALHEAGRVEEANTIAQAYSVVQSLFFAEHYPWLDEYDDPEFARQVEVSDRDYEEGRWSTHEEVMRRFHARTDG